MIQPVQDEGFGRRVLDRRGRTLVVFTAPWCVACKKQKPVLESISEDHDVVSINIDANYRTPIRYGVLSLPTYIVIEDGEPIANITGPQPERVLRAALTN